MNIKIDEHRYQTFVGSREVHLPRTEFKILAALAHAKGKVMSRLDLVRKIEGSEYGDMRSIDQYVTRLRKKLRLPEAIRTVMGAGYALDGAEFINEPKVYGVIRGIDRQKCTALVAVDFDTLPMLKVGGAVKVI
jgi:DNA-binding winged helix-turn-helix (wHTH) protein